MADGLIFEGSVNLAIKTIRQTHHSKLNMTPFQMQFGRKPRTAITNLKNNLNVSYLIGKDTDQLHFSTVNRTPNVYNK